jgi:hypothetical protein
LIAQHKEAAPRSGASQPEGLVGTKCLSDAQRPCPIKRKSVPQRDISHTCAKTEYQRYLLTINALKCYHLALAQRLA